MEINIAKDYARAPGGRFIKDGPNSGEDFRNKILKPKYLEAKAKKEKLIVNLDGGYGYATSFIEESFGGLVRITKDKNILDIIEIVSNDSPAWKDIIAEYIRDAEKNEKI